MPKPAIYLAGPVQHPDDSGRGWREYVEATFDTSADWRNPLAKYDVPAGDVEIVSGPPYEDDQRDDQISVAELVQADKQMIDESDAVLVGWSRVPSVGTPMEVLYAFERSKPVAVWYEPEGSAERVGDKTLSPWLDHHAGIVSESFTDCMDYLTAEVGADD